MTWTPITPETLPPVGVRILVGKPATETTAAWFDVARMERMSRGELVWQNDNWHCDVMIPSPDITHYCIPTPPGTPPAVTAEVKAVLGVDVPSLDRILDRAAGRDFEDFLQLSNLIDAIRAARAALGMDTKEQQP